MLSESANLSAAESEYQALILRAFYANVQGIVSRCSSSATLVVWGVLPGGSSAW
jgi:hypothetical protein